MRALITGAGGYIGSFLAERLIKDGWEVTLLDRFRGEKKKFIPYWKRKRGARIFRADISEIRELKPVIFRGADCIFHLSGRNHDAGLDDKPWEYHRANLIATANILEMARGRGSRIVFAASASCYGTAHFFPIPETAPLKLEDPYSLTKNLAEKYLLAWGMIYKIPVVSLRLFSVYGPKQKYAFSYGPLLTKLLAKKAQNRPYAIDGDGRLERDMVYIDDVVDAFIMAAESKISGEVFNVGSGQTMSLGRLIELLGGNAVFKSGKSNKIPKSQADITRIRKLLHWQPKVMPEEGIKKVLL